ncbi:MAG: hypothetical protein HYY17_16545 [Planctomycetes bacterium]|nr:hypothetical protein [Planctomycetota bacterium]
MNCDAGHPIRGKYWRYENGVVLCDGHNSSLPRCARCGVPSGRLVRRPGFSVCADCADRLPRCAACRAPTLRSWSMPDRPERSYCERCIRGRGACDFCSHPVGTGGAELSDGRFACAPCRRDLVRDPEAIARVFDVVKSGVHRFCGIRADSSLALHVVPPAEMALVAGSVFAPTHALDTRPLGLFTIRGGKRAIYVEDRLPKSIAITTLAHEYGHAWQYELGAIQPIPVLLEGFAELVAHKIARHGRLLDECRRISHRRDLYGAGYRIVAGLESKAGRTGMVATVKDRLLNGLRG